MSGILLFCQQPWGLQDALCSWDGKGCVPSLRVGSIISYSCECQTLVVMVPSFELLAVFEIVGDRRKHNVVLEKNDSYVLIEITLK